ncbi:unnamed protein product, partial [Prunus brigantina]
LLRSRISSFDPPFLNVVQGFWWLGLLGAIFLPISTGSFGFSVIGTADPSSSGHTLCSQIFLVIVEFVS